MLYLFLFLAIAGLFFELFSRIARWDNIRYSLPYFLLSLAYGAGYVYCYNTTTIFAQANFLVGAVVFFSALFALVWLVRIVWCIAD